MTATLCNRRLLRPLASAAFALLLCLSCRMAARADGLYPPGETITVTPEAAGTVYYTTDGSVPNRNSAVFSEPMEISQNTVLRMVSAEEGKALSKVTTMTFIFAEHDLPVVSLVSDPNGLFRGKNAVWQNQSRDDTCDGLFTFYNENGETEFQAECQLALHGATSRRAQKKSLKLDFGGPFAEPAEWDAFGTGPVAYGSLLLRTGHVNNQTIVRDNIMTEVVNDATGSLTMDSRYCVLYINGQYYGIYSLREDYSPAFMARKTDCSEESVAIRRAPVVQSRYDDSGLYELLEFITRHNMTDPENYARVCEEMDVQAFADWVVYQAYYHNTDVPGNIRYVRCDGTGGKWVPAMFDLDDALRTTDCGFEYVLDPQNQIGMWLNSLLKNDDFRALLLERSAWLLKNYLNPEYIHPIIDRHLAAVNSEIPRELKRWWGSDQETWDTYTGFLYRNTGEGRTGSYIQALRSRLGLTEEEKEQYFGELIHD